MVSGQAGHSLSPQDGAKEYEASVWMRTRAPHKDRFRTETALSPTFAGKGTSTHVFRMWATSGGHRHLVCESLEDRKVSVSVTSP